MACNQQGQPTHFVPSTWHGARHVGAQGVIGPAFAEVEAMSEHHAKVVWSRNEVDFSYQTYSRDHIWSFPGGVEVPASAAPEFLGSEQRVDPEEAFVAALSSCHMLTFLAIAAKKRIVIEEYQDEAVGFLEKNDMGKLGVTRVVLRPRVTFAQGSAQTKEQLAKLHQSAHENCFIANSVNTQVTVEA